jgi:hypothetical protein
MVVVPYKVYVVVDRGFGEQLAKLPPAWQFGLWTRLSTRPWRSGYGRSDGKSLDGNHDI